MINLLPVEKKNEPAYQRWVKFGSIVVLVCYIVVTAGWLGYWLFLSGREVKVSAQVESLTSQVRQLSEREKLLRLEFLRAKNIEQILASRSDVAALLTKILSISDTIELVGWEYPGQGILLVTAKGTNAQKLEEYLEKLKGEMKDAHLVKLIWSGSTGWEAEISVGALK